MSKKRPVTRARLLDTVLDRFVSGDGSALRMVDVAKAAGVTRQTVYDHFSNRSEMLIAAIVHFGEQLNVDDRLAESRAATSGADRMRAYTRAVIEFFPEIYPLQKALTRMGDQDRDAKSAWEHRMAAMKEGCAAAIDALHRDGTLRPGLSAHQAVDYYFTLLRIEAWSYCVHDCGWSERAYLDQVQNVTAQLFIADNA